MGLSKRAYEALWPDPRPDGDTTDVEAADLYEQAYKRWYETEERDMLEEVRNAH